MTKPITKSELVAELAESMESDKKTAAKSLDALCDIILKRLEEGDAVTLPNVGKLFVRDRAARTVRNPATGDVIKKPADRVAKMTYAKALKEAINK